MNEINLISGKNLSFERQNRTLRRLRIAALVSLFIVSLVSVIFFIITLLLPISQVKNNQTQTLQGISKLHDKLTTFILTKERLINIENIISQRKEFPKMFSTLLNLFSSDMSISLLSLDSNSLSLTVSSASLITINKLIDDLTLLSNNNSNVSNLSVESLQYNSGSGDYTVTFQANTL